MFEPKNCSTPSIQEAMIEEIGVKGNAKKEAITREAVELAIEWSKIVGGNGWDDEKTEYELKESCRSYVVRNHSYIKKESKSKLSLIVTVPLAVVSFIIFGPLIWLIVGVFVTWLMIDEVARQNVRMGGD